MPCLLIGQQLHLVHVGRISARIRVLRYTWGCMRKVYLGMHEKGGKRARCVVRSALYIQHRNAGRNSNPCGPVHLQEGKQILMQNTGSHLCMSMSST